MQLVATHSHRASDRFNVGVGVTGDHFVAHDVTPTPDRGHRTNLLASIAGILRNHRPPTLNAARHAVIQANGSLEPLGPDVRCNFVYVTNDHDSAEIGLAGSCRAAAFGPDGRMTWTSDASLIPSVPNPRISTLGDDYPQEVWDAEAAHLADSPPLDGKSATHSLIPVRYISLEEGTHIVVATPDMAWALTDSALTSMLLDPDTDRFRAWLHAKSTTRDPASINGGVHVIRASQLVDA